MHAERPHVVKGIEAVDAGLWTALVLVPPRGGMDQGPLVEPTTSHSAPRRRRTAVNFMFDVDSQLFGVCNYEKIG